MGLRKRIAAASAVLVTAGAAVGLAAPTAQAETRCSTLYLCLYYNSNQQGSFRVFVTNTPDFAGYTFTGDGAGYGQAVKNNAASATNGFPTSSGRSARIFYNSNYGGVYDNVGPSSARNLSNTYNENASFHWVTS